LHNAEHIVLESDNREVPKLKSSRKSHATLRCRTRLRRRRLSLSIIDYYYLAVSIGRGKAVDEYVLDLRFVDPNLPLTRHIPWRGIWAAFVLTVLAASSAWWYVTGAPPRWQHFAALMSATLFAAVIGSYLVVAFRLSETVALRSVHGCAILLEYKGGPGTLRIAHPFMRKLAAHIKLAGANRRSTRREHLRDELREHFRLKEAGVLSREVYEASKARILAQHASVRRKD
jgi:hypothetical protein